MTSHITTPPASPPPDLVVEAGAPEPRTHAATVERMRSSVAGALPSWFTIPLVFALVWTAVAGAFGAALLDWGGYQPLLVAVVATVTAATAAVFVAPRPRPGERREHRATVVAVVIGVLLAVFAGVFHSEHLLTDRDPAIYINTGRTIARNHELHPVVATGVFADSTRFDARTPSLGVTNGRLQPNFFFMLPVLLALGWSAGGDTGLLLVPALLGGLGVLALYALASRVVGARCALVATGVLVAAPLELWFARDAYSELVVQALGLGGIWLLLEARTRSFALAPLAAALIASTVLARVDALAVAACALVGGAAIWTYAGVSESPTRSRRLALVYMGTLVAAGVAAVALSRALSATYLSTLRDEYAQLSTVAALVVVACLVLVLVRQLFPRAFRRLGAIASRTSTITIAFGTVVVVFSALFIWALVLRVPAAGSIPTAPRGAIPNEVRNAMNAWHFRWSLRWFVEYYGLVAVFAALAGMFVLAWRALRRDVVAAIALLIVVPVAALYIARPRVTPDQPWAMRRYLPVVIPGLALFVAVALAALWTSRRGWTGVARRVGTVIVGLGVAVPCAISMVPFVNMQMQQGAEAAVHQICTIAGDDSALIVARGNYLDLLLPSTTRAFCNVPSARLVNEKNADLAGIAREWRAQGRRLLVAAPAPGFVEKSGAPYRLLARLSIPDAREPERTMERRPTRSRARPEHIWLYEITAS
jgi:hypothetical protein